jgi:hypothetical protein
LAIVHGEVGCGEMGTPIEVICVVPIAVHVTVKSGEPSSTSIVRLGVMREGRVRPGGKLATTPLTIGYGHDE